MRGARRVGVGVQRGARARSSTITITRRRRCGRCRWPIVPFGWQGSGAARVRHRRRRQRRTWAAAADSRRLRRATWCRGRRRPSQVNFQDWRTLDADYLVIGSSPRTRRTVSPRCSSSSTCCAASQLLGLQADRPAAQDLRATAHRISDMIFQELTGIPGVFSTQIAYISEERRADNTRAVPLDRRRTPTARTRSAIAESPQPLMSPSWSPDARRIAYVSFEGGQSAVYVQTLRTGTRERVSARAGVNSSPAFSPDGRLLALTLSRDHGQPRHPHARSVDASVAPAHDRCCDRYRSRLVAGRPHASTSPRIAPAARRSIASRHGARRAARSA